jgi:hypothetical protein
MADSSAPEDEGNMFLRNNQLAFTGHHEIISQKTELFKLCLSEFSLSISGSFKSSVILV